MSFSRPCAKCGNEFTSADRVQKYCSARCRNRNRKLFSGTCLVCGCEFRSERKGKKLCSLACVSAYNIRRHALPVISCARCGTEFRKRADRHGYNKYCSRACYFGSPHSRQVAKESRKLSKRKRMAIVERDKWKCRDCGCRVRDDVDDRHPRKANVDHVIPLSLGGTNEDHNLQCLCRSCNARKRDRKVVLF